MTDPNPNHEVGGVEELMADDALRHVHAAFTHRAKAADLEVGVQPLTPFEAQQLLFYGPYSFASPVFGKVVLNSGRRALASLHRLAAARILPEPMP